MYKVLTIAGSDCSGGAGIQADLKTIAAHGHYGMSVITALTAQNTLQVSGIEEVSPDFVSKQMDAVFTDIRPDFVKTGMLSSAAIIECVCQKLRQYQVDNLVIDPVMVSTSGCELLQKSARQILVEQMLQLAKIITPNIPEAQILSGRSISSSQDMEEAARAIGDQLPGAVLIKGGHFDGAADDLVYYQGHCHWLRGVRIDNTNTHGTGCTLSSAIACNLAAGYGLVESVQKAKNYVSGALRAQLNLGQGRGPLDHLWNLSLKDEL